jgi:hypothetical protein
MGHSFYPYRSSYQGGAEPPHQEARGRRHRRNLFPPGCLHRINPRQEIAKGPQACHPCNPERLFGLRMLVNGPPFQDLRGTWFRRHVLRDVLARSFPRLERCRHEDAWPHNPKLRIDIKENSISYSYNFRFSYHRFFKNIFLQLMKMVNYVQKLKNFICVKNSFPK